MTTDRTPFEEAPGLKRFSMHVRHGFFGRRGGVSKGFYNSLNCGHGSRDDPEKVRENRRRVCEALGSSLERLASPRQVHSAKAEITDRAYEPAERPECDALVTSRPGLLLAVLSADCAPIVLCDPHNGVAAAVHAGWRGAVGGVLESTLEAMARLGADPARTAAAVGPCLSQTSFEVGPDLADAVLAASPWAETLFRPGSNDRQFFDLKRYCLGQLIRLGVSHCEALTDDTLSQPEDYFSHRAAQKAGHGDSGRNMTGIMLLG
jgi:YfiH family protein